VQASWQVVGQRQSSVLANGQFEQAMVVTFKTGSGVTGSVTLPISQYSPENVRKAIQAQADAIEAVHSLSSGTPSD
jgi:hypothetical protein